ncbi:MAG: hypothetical protein JRN57_04145 [Nitrososphaerota archaeon]|nr:hypothetical protein [Nitrososphaerota archaeon]
MSADSPYQATRKEEPALRLRTLLGVLSTLFWFIAILSVAVPVASVMIPGALAVTPLSNAGAPSGVQLSIPPGYVITNHGFLPIDGVQLVVVGHFANGSQLFSLTAGPVDLAPGQATTVNIAATLPDIGNVTTPAQAQALQAEFSDVSITATASANLAGIIPISASADLSVSQLFNSTSLGGTPGGP